MAAGLTLVVACGGESTPATSTASPTVVAPVGRTAETAPSPAATREPDLSSPQFTAFRQVVDAVNRGDVPGALKHFTDDVVWERGGQCPPTMCKGVQAVQRELTRDVGAHHELRPLTGEMAAGGLQVRAEVRTDGTRRGGVDRIIQIFALEMRGEQISAVRVSFDMADAVTAGFVTSQAGTQQR